MSLEKTAENPAQPYLRDVLILALVTLGIGIYLIATTVVVSKDGVFYIENTRNILIRPLEILTARPAGYELLILSVQQLWKILTGDLSLQTQVWIAQGVTLFCRVLAVIFIYFIGRVFVERKTSFWGCVILVLLPEPAHMGSDALREWPYLMLTAMAVLYLVKGVQNRKLKYFALMGLAGGLGLLIRVESIQLLILGCGILGILIVISSTKQQRLLWVGGIGVLIITFALPKLIYAGYTGQFATQYLRHYQTTAQSTLHVVPDKEPPLSEGPASTVAPDQTISTLEEHSASASDVERSVWGLCYELFKDAGELLVWFFLPFWIIGLWVHLSDKANSLVRGIVAAVIVMGLGMIAARYWLKEPSVSVRWILPIVALTVFYIYAGIEQTAKWLVSGKAEDRQLFKKWVCILTGIGLLACLPKLIQPLGKDKQVYRDVINWVSANTQPNDWFYTYDRRMIFYADRPYHVYDEDIGLIDPLDTSYLVAPGKDQMSTIELPDDAVFEIAFERRGKEVLIYRRTP